METFITKRAQSVIGTLSGFDRSVFQGTLRFLVQHGSSAPRRRGVSGAAEG
jgi:hypothetical protein